MPKTKKYICMILVFSMILYIPCSTVASLGGEWLSSSWIVGSEPFPEDIEVTMPTIRNVFTLGYSVALSGSYSKKLVIDIPVELNYQNISADDSVKIEWDETNRQVNILYDYSGFKNLTLKVNYNLDKIYSKQIAVIKSTLYNADAYGDFKQIATVENKIISPDIGRTISSTFTNTDGTNFIYNDIETNINLNINLGTYFPLYSNISPTGALKITGANIAVDLSKILIEKPGESLRAIESGDDIRFDGQLFNPLKPIINLSNLTVQSGNKILFKIKSRLPDDTIIKIPSEAVDFIGYENGFSQIEGATVSLLVNEKIYEMKSPLVDAVDVGMVRIVSRGISYIIRNKPAQPLFKIFVQNMPQIPEPGFENLRFNIHVPANVTITHIYLPPEKSTSPTTEYDTPVTLTYNGVSETVGDTSNPKDPAVRAVYSQLISPIEGGETGGDFEIMISKVYANKGITMPASSGYNYTNCIRFAGTTSDTSTNIGFSIDSTTIKAKVNEDTIKLTDTDSSNNSFSGNFVSNGMTYDPEFGDTEFVKPDMVTNYAYGSNMLPGAQFYFMQPITTTNYSYASSRKILEDPVLFFSIPSQFKAWDGNWDYSNDILALISRNNILNPIEIGKDIESIEVETLDSAASLGLKNAVEIGGFYTLNQDSTLVKVSLKGLTIKESDILKVYLKLQLPENYGLLEQVNFPSASMLLGTSSENAVGVNYKNSTSATQADGPVTNISSVKNILGNELRGNYLVGKKLPLNPNIVITIPSVAGGYSSLSPYTEGETFAYYLPGEAMPEVFLGRQGRLRMTLLNYTALDFQNPIGYLEIPRGDGFRLTTTGEMSETFSDNMNSVTSQLYYTTLDFEQGAGLPGMIDENDWHEFSITDQLPKNITCIRVMLPYIASNGGKYQMTFPVLLEKTEDDIVYGEAKANIYYQFSSNTIESARKGGLRVVLSSPPTFDNMPEDTIIEYFTGDTEEINSQIKSISVNDDINIGLKLDDDLSKVDFVPEGSNTISETFKIQDFPGVSNKQLGTYFLTYVTEKDYDDQSSLQVLKVIVKQENPYKVVLSQFDVSAKTPLTENNEYVYDLPDQQIDWLVSMKMPIKDELEKIYSFEVPIVLPQNNLVEYSGFEVVDLDNGTDYTNIFSRKAVSADRKTFTLEANDTLASEFLDLADKNLQIKIFTTYNGNKSGVNVNTALRTQAKTIINSVYDNVKTFTVTVANKKFLPIITTPSGELSQAILSESYLIKIQADNSPIGFMLSSGSLPNALSLLSDGTISGTPIEEGIFNFGIKAFNEVGESDETLFSISVNSLTAIPVITSMSGELPQGVVNKDYTAKIVATNNPTNFLVTNGSLPTGLILSKDGVIGGVATEKGKFNFDIKAVNLYGESESVGFSIEILDEFKKPIIITSSDGLPNGRVNSYYKAKIYASEEPSSFYLTDSSLPKGLSLVNSGEIMGTPTEAGLFDFYVTATNEVGSDTKKFYIFIEEIKYLENANTNNVNTNEQIDNADNSVISKADKSTKYFIIENGVYKDPDSIDTSNNNGYLSAEPNQDENEVYFIVPVKVLNDYKSQNEKFVLQINSPYGNFNIDMNVTDLVPNFNELIENMNLNSEDVSLKLILTDKTLKDDYSDEFSKSFLLNHANIQNIFLEHEVQILRVGTNELIGTVNTFEKPVSKYIKLPLGLDNKPKNYGVVKYDKESKQFEFLPHKTKEITGEWFAYITTATNDLFVMNFSDNVFKDVSKEHWANKAINLLALNALVQGVGGNKFVPDTNITRAQFSQMVSNVLSLSKSKYDSKEYIDVKKEHWAYNAIMNLKDLGVFNKFEYDKFNPDTSITREEIASIISQVVIQNTPQNFFQTNDIKNQFKDFNEIDKRYVDDISLIYSLKLMQGRGNGVFDPKGLTKRSECAQLILNLIQILGLIE